MVAGTNIAGGLKSSSASSLLSTSTSEANIAKTSDPEITKSSDHIYEEIQSNEKKESTSSQKRPLPPIPGHKGKIGSTISFLCGISVGFGRIPLPYACLIKC